MNDLSRHVPMAESFAPRADDAGRMARSFLAAMARLAEVERVAALELPCQQCSGSNPVWWAPNDLWNAVVGTPDDTRGNGVILCPSCFCVRAAARLAEVEAERDEWREELTASEKWRRGIALERDDARTRLAAVLALCDRADGQREEQWTLHPVIPAFMVRAAAAGDDRG